MNKVFHVLIGVFLLASLECGKSDHVHVKIHIPDIHHKHKHLKTKYVHVYHPRVIHTDHASYVHSRNDPNIGLVNGGYPQPLVNLNHHRPELRITEEEFLKWRKEQFMRALEERRKLQEQYGNNPESYDGDDDNANTKDDPDAIEDESKITSNLFRKHKANKANSSSTRYGSTRHRNHNYNQEFGASNYEKHYTHYPNRQGNKKKKHKQTDTVRQAPNRPKKNQNSNFHYQQAVEASNLQPSFYNGDPTALDPTYYSTLPKDQQPEPSDHQDDIYSEILSSKYNKNIMAKAKLLADINYNRKQQTKIFTSQRRRG
ncbi:CLUMA_CG007237, isoform A [Clunio marinus]|uniref:CLUMA_CG007237, isoform A n=1 Tax=Clunio marinus TaxID=568069 RepID=A0A1J1I0B6_9DIPT|nr:CLUMA_CG007237, isoform A [Clunio marinus]